MQSEHLLFDIEADELLVRVKRMWILVVVNIYSGEITRYLEHDFGWKERLSKAAVVVGHNILGYDLPLLKKLFDFELPKEVAIVDTMLLSQILDYNRFGGLSHKLARWGELLGYPKFEFNDFSQYSEEMAVYCVRDCTLNVKVYLQLLIEYKATGELYKASGGDPRRLKAYVKAEHKAAWWCSLGQLHGWPFDVKAAKHLREVLEAKMWEATSALSARLGFKAVAVDKALGIVEEKKPKWLKNGCYDSHTCRWFDVSPFDGVDERPILGPFSRVTFEKLTLESVADVKIFLYRNNWVPTEWNIKVDEETRQRTKTTPKITDDSLEFLGGDGKLYLEYRKASSRLGVLKTWLENVDEDGNLHGDCMLIGTPSMRARHSIIVNIPSSDAAYGKEMRSLFGCKPGWKLLGCDSKGNQARGLAHFLGDAGFIDTLLNGDIHQYNADKLTQIVRTIPGVPKDHVVTRGQAKRILYAFLFGAGGDKLWSYVFGVLDKAKGDQLKAGFISAVPGFESLLEKLKEAYRKSKTKGKWGSITSVAGNKIYVDSLHKLLVYHLQATEKVTCSAAIMVAMEELEKAGIPYIPCIYYHDEIDFMVPEEHAEQAAEIGKAAFAAGPKLFGIQIMDGDAKIGDTWYDVH